MIKLKDLIVEKTTKRGFEVIKQITGGDTKSQSFGRFGNMTKAKWVQHHETGIMFGGGRYKGGITGAQIFSQGGNKYRVEILKAVMPKPKIVKKINNVDGDMLYSTLKKYLGI